MPIIKYIIHKLFVQISFSLLRRLKHVLSLIEQYRTKTFFSFIFFNSTQFVYKLKIRILDEIHSYQVLSPVSAVFPEVR